MAASGQGIRNIDFCVALVMNDINDYSQHVKARLMQLAFNGFRELNLLSMPNIKVVHATLNDINCWNFPIDYLYFTKLAINLNGRLYTLTRNDDLMLNRAQECGIETLETLQADTNCDCFGWGYSFMPHWYGGSWYPKLYGMGGGINNAGYYRIDNEMRRIQFSSLIPQTDLVIEYKSNGLEPDGSALVPEAYVAALQEYIHWKNIEYNPRVSQGEKQRRFEMYDMYFNTANYLTNSFTESEYLDATYAEFSASAKR